MAYLVIFLLLSNSNFYLSRLKYSGGDWYNDPSALVNLTEEVNRRLNLDISTQQQIVDIHQAWTLQVPFIYMTGHGEINFTSQEQEYFRKYIEEGGFVYIDDDYGMDAEVREELSKIFPHLPLTEISSDHIIYHWPYQFPQGLPKIHQHDQKAPQGWGIEMDGRLVVFYSYESNISDGWVNPDVHGDPEEIREASFKMGVNIICYAMTH
ncbi:MAG: hypothetical protein APR63_00490 [Desulfuromonas sp. SDB]|nr:MAG: hypothetical protein APR63_00490 [Desulfuromonas sp. SDB]